jgi:hypothetical protein
MTQEVVGDANYLADKFASHVMPSVVYYCYCTTLHPGYSSCSLKMVGPSEFDEDYAFERVACKHVHGTDHVKCDRRTEIGAVETVAVVVVAAADFVVGAAEPFVFVAGSMDSCS